MNKEEESRLGRFRKKLPARMKPIALVAGAFAIAAGAYVVIKRNHDKKEALKKIADQVASSSDPAAALINGAEEFAQEVGSAQMTDITAGLANLENSEAMKDVYDAMTALAKPTPQSNRPTS